MISANGVEYKNVPEQVQYLTEQVADIWTAIEGINPPDLTLYALKTYVDAADSALSTRITAVENSIGTLLTKTEAANTYAKIADIGTYINLSDYVKTTDMYTYVQTEIQNFDLDSNTDFTALKSRVSTLESSVSSMTSDIADANTTAANAQTAAGNAVNTANNASAVATNAYNTATSAASDVADMQTTINNYDSRIDAVESTVDGFQASLTTAKNTANAALAKADSALSMIAGLHSLTKQEVEFEGDSVTVAGFVEGSLCTLTKLDGKTEYSRNLINVDNGIIITSGNYPILIALPAGTYTLSASVKCIDLRIDGKYQGWIRMTDANGNRMINTNLIGLHTFTSVGETITINKTFTLSNPAMLDTSFIDFGRYYSDGASVEISHAMLSRGSTALPYVPYYTGLKSVSISGLLTGGGVVITTSEGTTSLVPTLDDDTLELGSYDYMEQVISGTQLTTSLVTGGELIHLTSSDTWNDSEISSYRRMVINIEEIKSVSGRTDDVICDKFYYSGNTSNEGTFFHNLKGLYFFVPSSVTTLAEWKTYLDSIGGIYVYILLETPVTTVLATVTYTDVSAFFETGTTITVNNANTEYGVESTSTMYGYVAE